MIRAGYLVLGEAVVIEVCCVVESGEDQMIDAGEMVDPIVDSGWEVDSIDFD